ncbi:MAG: hypothetical protein F6K58_06920 [Symploca sp. SIO2E9]|nr:hypothetical protein [Symploca sp. SIO2E9]
MAIIEKHQHIYGGVWPNGELWFGEDFQSKKIKDGTYIIEFKQPFSKIPAPVCTINGYEWRTFDKSVAVIEIWEGGFICTTSSPKMPEDCAFTFIVFGDV